MSIAPASRFHQSRVQVCALFPQFCDDDNLSLLTLDFKSLLWHDNEKIFTEMKFGSLTIYWNFHLVIILDEYVTRLCCSF